MKRISLIYFLIIFVFAGNILSAQNELPLKFRTVSEKDSGFINTYILKDKVFFEIPINLMGRDMLIASRVSELSNTKNRSKLVAGQMLHNPVLVNFSFDEKFVYLNKVNPDKLIDKQDPLYASFKRNNLIPVVTSFDIEAKTSESIFIDVTAFFKDDLPYVSPVGGPARPGKLDSKLTKILSVKAFDENIEIRTRNCYTGGREPFVAIMQKSLVLLSEKPMKPRIADIRMNCFTSDKKIFSTKNQEVQKVSYVHRFDIRPKQEDLERFKRGELVVPRKQIVFHVDTALPYKWREAVKRGIEYWNIAFEKIGFKNVIVAKDYPRNDPDFNPDDIRFNCFKYIATEMANATGPHWVDPRSGEIIQADVLWFDNVRKLLHEWRFLHTSAVDPRVRKKVFDDDIMCEMISYSAAHEIGHCLGQVHNMRASYAYPTDSLRSATFTQKYGTTPSIMDYARFNYVAQPGDKGINLLPPHVGLYDMFSIKLAYKPVFDVKDEYEENDTVRQWIAEKETDPLYIFNRQSGMAVASDPSRQTVALGDDAVKSSRYGIKNLKYTLEHLKEWMYDEADGYDYINGLYNDLFDENFRFIRHTIAYIGGIYEYNTINTENVPFAVPVERDKSVEAIEFIFNQLYTQQEWLNSEYVRSFAGNKEEEISKAQRDILNEMLNVGIFRNLYINRHMDNILTTKEYLSQMTEKLFLSSYDSDYIKSLQLFYIDYLAGLRTREFKNSDELFLIKLRHIANEELDNIKKIVSKNIKRYKSKEDKEYLSFYLKKILEN